MKTTKGSLTMLLSVVFALCVLPSLALALCVTPANDSTYLVNTSTSLCNDSYYNNTHLVINSNSLILNCNNSVLDGFDDAGIGININNFDSVQITDCTVRDYQTGVAITDSNDSTVQYVSFISNDMYDINTYRATNTWLQYNDMTDGASSVRLDDTSTDNIILQNMITNMTDYGIITAQNCDDNDIIRNNISDIGLPSGGYCIAVGNTIGSYIYLNNLSGCRYGVYADTPPSIIIDENIMHDNADTGIFIDNDNSNYTVADITSNTIYTTGKEGLYAMGLTQSNITGNDISDVGSDGAFAGLFVYITNSTTIDWNLIYDNHWAGIEIRNIYDDIFTNNVVWNNGDSGFIVMSESTNINILGNVFTNNTDDGITIVDYPLRYSNITNNGIHDNQKDGIYIDCSEMVDPELELTISDNRLNNSSDEGIDILDCNNITVSGNNVSYSGEHGLWLDGTDYVTVSAGRYCNNNQSAGAFWDVLNQGTNGVFSNVLCDLDSPNTTCKYPCSYTPPVDPITIVSPTNITYYNDYVWHSITVDVNMSKCFAWSDGTNYTMSNSSSAIYYYNVTSLADGSHWANFTCNDTYNDWYRSSLELYTVDTAHTPSGIPTIIVLIMAVCGILITYGLLQKAMDGELDAKDIMLALMVFGGLLAVFISVLGAM